MLIQARRHSSGVLYSQTQSVAIVDTDALEHTLINSTNAKGSPAIPASSMQVGDIYLINASYVVTNPSVVNSAILRTYVNSTLLGTTASSVFTTTTTNGILFFPFTVLGIGASGSIAPNGYATANSGNVNYLAMQNAAAITIDTTIAQTINFTVQWSGTGTVGTHTFSLLGNLTLSRLRVGS